MKQILKLKLGGKNRVFTFGIVFLGELLDRKEFEDYDDLLQKVSKNTFKYAPILMYESLVNTCRKNSTDVDFTESDLINWLEKDYEKGLADMLEFIQFFFGTNENKTPTEETNKTDTVKKK